MVMHDERAHCLNMVREHGPGNDCYFLHKARKLERDDEFHWYTGLTAEIESEIGPERVKAAAIDHAEFERLRRPR